MLPECPADKVKTIFSRLTSFELKRNGKPFTVSYSQGVAQYQVGDTPKEMIRRADERLYAEKQKRFWLRDENRGASLDRGLPVGMRDTDAVSSS